MPPGMAPAGSDGWRRPPAAVVLAVGVLVVGLAAVQASRTLRVGGVDLGGYVRAGRAVLQGGFDRDAWENAWPPFFSLLMVPLAAAARALPSFRHVVALWLVLDLAATVALVAVAVRAASPARRPPGVAYLLTALLAAPWLRNNLQYGQVNTALALLCTLAFARLDRGRDAAGPGVLLGVAASAKVQAVLLVPWLLLAGRRRALRGALVTAAACAVAPALLYGPAVLASAWAFWVREAVPAHQGGFGVSLPAVAHHWASLLAGAPLAPLPRRPGAEALGSALALGSAAALLAHLAQARRARPLPPVLDLAALLPVAVLATPLAWRYHLVALVPACAAVSVYLLSAGGTPSRRRATAALVVASALLAGLSELGAVGALAAAVETAERLGSCVASAAAAVAALLVARGDLASPGFENPSAAP